MYVQLHPVKDNIVQDIWFQLSKDLHNSVQKLTQNLRNIILDSSLLLTSHPCLKSSSYFSIPIAFWFVAGKTNLPSLCTIYLSLCELSTNGYQQNVSKA